MKGISVQRVIKLIAGIGLLISLGLLTLTPILAAPPQQGQTGSLIGIVYHVTTGQRLIGANVTAVCTGATTQTGSNGLYQFDNLPVGECRVEATFAGYQPNYRLGFVMANDTRWASIPMIPLADTPTPTPTSIATNTPTPTSTPVPTNTSTPTPTNTPLPTNTPIPTPTDTATPTPTATPTNTPIPTNTPTNTPLPTNTPEPTATATATPTPGTLVTPTFTPTPGTLITPTSTPTPGTLVTPTFTPTPGTLITPTSTPTPGTLITPTSTPTPGTLITPTSTPTPGTVITPTFTPTPGTLITPTSTPGTLITPTPGTVITPTFTPTPPGTVITPTLTPTPPGTFITPTATENGTLIGVTYHGRTGQRVSGVTVVALCTGEILQSDAYGFYRFENLPLGECILSGDKVDYFESASFGQVLAGQTRWASLRMDPTFDQTGTIIGILYDAQSSARIAQATVTACNGDTVESSSTGLYRFVNLPIGSCDITAEKTGYQTATKTAFVMIDTVRWNSIAMQSSGPGVASINSSNSGGYTNIFDLSYIANHYGQEDFGADLNLDGTVNIFDLVIAASNYQK